MGRNNIPRIYFTCGYCGDLASDRPSHFVRKESHFCSNRCYSLYRQYFLPKEYHNAYGHGHIPEERKRRRQCRSTLNHAIRDGVLLRGTCIECGVMAEAHHPDYSKPLDVRWLCLKHHRIYENPELIQEQEK